MANRFTEAQDNDNLVDAINNFETEASAALDALEAPEPAITNANVDNSDAGAKVNAILAALRAKGIIES